MGIRGELFSTRITCEGRTYFFNVKENRMGDVFLTIVESKPTEADNFDRRSIVLFKDDVKDFLKAFQSALSFIEGGRASTLRYAPAVEGPRPQRARPHAGFAGSAPKADSEPAIAAPEKKRRIVVRRKEGTGPRTETPISPPEPTED